MTNKEFWNKVEPAMSEKSNNAQSDIILKEGEDFIKDDQLLSAILNDQYVNIVEISTGSAPSTLGNIVTHDKESI